MLHLQSPGAIRLSGEGFDEAWKTVFSVQRSLRDTAKNLLAGVAVHTSMLSDDSDSFCWKIIPASSSSTFYMIIPIMSIYIINL